MPGVRLVLEPVPSECNVMEQIEAGITPAMEDIIAALTRPLTAAEKSPRAGEREKPGSIIFKGSLKEVNQFFYKRGWTDGLPVLPPTEEEVAEMLKGTDLPADHVVAELIPRLGKATVEKIAINAVMAGALPTHLPVLIAGVKALLEPGAVYHWLHSSGASPAPLWVINGPIRSDLHVNSGFGALSPGDIANSAIGRAMGLIIKNIGGARKGIEEMGCMGNPAKYNMVIAENEEDSPWEPLHVEHGLDKGDSAITIFTVLNGLTQIGSSYGTDVRGILSGMIYNVKGKNPGLACFMITPAHANILAGEGWTKGDIKAFISENATAPSRGTYTATDHLRKRLPFNPGDPFRLLPSPERIMIVVAGGSGPVSGALVQGFLQQGIGFVSKKIDLPANWGNLVARYKGLVPSYIKY